MSDFPEYFGILPARVRYDPVLSAGAKVLYADIGALCRLNGFCGATNGYFARLYGVSQTCVSLWISQLIRGGYVINTNESSQTGESERENPFKKTQNRCLKIVKRGLEKKLKQDNTDTQSIKTDTQGNNNPRMAHNPSLLDMLLAKSMEQASVYKKKLPLSSLGSDPLKPIDSGKKKVPLSEENTLKILNKSGLKPAKENESYQNGETSAETPAKTPLPDGADSMPKMPQKNESYQSCRQEGEFIRDTAPKSDFSLKATKKAFEECFGLAWGDKRVLEVTPFKNENNGVLEVDLNQAEASFKKLGENEVKTSPKDPLPDGVDSMPKMPRKNESYQNGEASAETPAKTPLSDGADSMPKMPQKNESLFLGSSLVVFCRAKGGFFTHNGGGRC